MRTVRQRRWLAGALAVSLVALLLLLAVLDGRFHGEPPELVTRTTVELYQPPPPAPPPARPSNARAGGSTGTTLPNESRRVPVTQQLMALDVNLSAMQTGELELGGLGRGIGVGSGDGTGDGAGTGFGLFTLSELDQVPVVVSAPLFPYPEEASARGLAEFDLRFSIVIDEEGRTYPIALVQSPFPELSAEFMQWASRVRFTPPTRLGIPVRAEYTWPVKIKR